ncbi:MAG: hypothetical protein ACK42E_03875 [Candidatus Bipolaricaulaceae bacterium]
MWKNRKLWLLVLVGLLAVGTVGYVVYAQTTEGSRRTFLARVAEKLGVTEDALLSAMYEARAEMIDEAVAEGKLTQAQADYLKAVLKAKLEYYKAEGWQRGFGFGLRGFGHGHGCGMGWGRGPGWGFGPRWQAPANQIDR